MSFFSRIRVNISPKLVLFFMLLVIFFISLLIFIVVSIKSAEKTNNNAFAYTIKVQNAYEELDMIFERAEVNLNVLADSISNSYNTDLQQNKEYNIHYIKNLDGLIKSVLINSPGTDGCWFQINADLPFSVQAYNWYQFRDDQFINLRDYFQNTLSMNRKITPNDDPYYFDALNKPIPTWSGIYVDTDTTSSMLTVSEPVYKDTVLVGVAGIDVSTEDLKLTMKNLQLILGDSELYLLDKNDNVMLSQFFNDKKPAKMNYPFIDLLKNGKLFPVEYYQNLTKKTAIELILSNNYKLVIVIENKVLFGNMNVIFNLIYTLFTLIFILLSLFFIVHFKVIQLDNQILSTDTVEDESEEIDKVSDNE